MVFHLTISYPLVSKTCSKSLMNTTSVLSFFNTQTWVTLNYFTIRLCDIYIPNICFLSKFIAISLSNIWALLNTLSSRIKAALKKKPQFRWKKIVNRNHTQIETAASMTEYFLAASWLLFSSACFITVSLNLKS